MKEFIKSENYQPVIGFEIHVQLATKSKMFGPAPYNPDETVPNTNVDEIVTAEPGTLPVANKEAIKMTAMMGLALNSHIDEWSKFDRKHYFYPDLPKGYQISQYDQPIARGGYLDIVVKGEKRRINLTRAHLEEDAGKNIHPEGLPYSLVDYNRAGSALLEIVTEPEITSGEEAYIFLNELRNIVRYLGVSSADMEKGTLRCEPSISVRKPGETTLPKYKVEVKNINSFRFAQAAIDYEIARQTEILKEGGTPKQVTMGWNEKTNQTVEQRSKEEANDYRYFPEPDLPVLQFTKEYLEDLKNHLPELPAQKRARFKEEFGLSDADTENLINWKELANYFEAVVSELDEWVKADAGVGADEALAKLDGRPQSKDEDGRLKAAPTDRQFLIKQAANWCLQDFSALLNSKLLNPTDSLINPENFAELVKLIAQGKISGSAAKQIFKVMFEKGGEPLSIIQDLGLEQTSDEGAIAEAIDKVLAANEKAVTDYKAGQQKSFGFLVGMAMKELKGKGNPQMINELLKKKLSN